MFEIFFFVVSLFLVCLFLYSIERIRGKGRQGWEGMEGKGREGHRTLVALGGAVIGHPEMERAVDHRWNSLESGRQSCSLRPDTA